MRIGGLLLAAVLAISLAAFDAQAQGNSDCSGTIQGGGGEGSCNAYGLCRAFFAGSDRGREQKRKAMPFQALIEAACGMCDSGCECTGDASCDDDEDMCVAEFCPDTNPGGHGKNPGGG